VVKRLLYPLANERAYQWAQALAKAWDIRTGSWKETELALIPIAVREGDTTLDVGANYGLYSYHLSRAVGRSGRVFAFEPLPFTYATLVRVARLLRLDNVELVPMGCSDQTGPVTFRVPVQASGAISAGVAHLSRRNNDRTLPEGHVARQWGGFREVAARVVRLDEFLPAIQSLSFVKFDIEGAELLAVRGAREVIERHSPTVVCEIDPWYLEGFGFTVEQIAGFFLDRGYAIHRCDRSSATPRLKRTELRDVVEGNYVFVHPRWRERLATLIDPE
jgi:FkbM family methyltransferase